VFKGKTDAEQLTLECLRYMYRLLFLFYIESRPGTYQESCPLGVLQLSTFLKVTSI